MKFIPIVENGIVLVYGPYIFLVKGARALFSELMHDLNRKMRRGASLIILHIQHLSLLLSVQLAPYTEDLRRSACVACAACAACGLSSAS